MQFIEVTKISGDVKNAKCILVNPEHIIMIEKESPTTYTHIYLSNGTVISVLETPREISLSVSNSISKPKTM